MRTLKHVSVGETVKIHRINGAGALQRRIMDLGLLKGCEIFVRKVAPLGDPMVINVRGYELSLRKSEADVIVIE
ncbi:MAG: ferrous iron transport protein A [Lentisphaerae bacterium]|jgi:ferrous iron transport protein A|nr:ferrous iron transport protein A [Lentisphaerota bacterium]